MFANSRAFAGISTNDLARAKEFYADTLGLDVTDEHGVLTLHLAGGGQVLIYPKTDHVAGTHTMLNFPVPDIEQAVDALAGAGVRLERYPGVSQDDRGIAREFGPPIAWFTDPAGNILAVVQA